MAEPISTLGGPIFRRTDSTHNEFKVAWRRHAQLVTPWFLQFGVKDYTQIHFSSTSSGISTTGKSSSSSFNDISPETLARAKRVLRQADGVAIVCCVPASTRSGENRPFGDGSLHPYFQDVIAVDERSFLHTESGATAVIPEKPEFDVPQLDALMWRALATELTDLTVEEVVVIKDGNVLLETEETW